MLPKGTNFRNKKEVSQESKKGYLRWGLPKGTHLGNTQERVLEKGVS